MKAYVVDKTDTERDFNILRVARSLHQIMTCSFVVMTNHSAMHERSLFIWTISLFSFEKHVSWLGIVRRVTPPVGDSCAP